MSISKLKFHKLPINSIFIKGVKFKLLPSSKAAIYLNDDRIWSFPDDFRGQGQDVHKWDIHYDFHLDLLYDYMKSYLDTPRIEIEDFPSKPFEWSRSYYVGKKVDKTGNFCGLRDILKAADKRLGKKRIDVLLFSTSSDTARKIILYRLGLL